MSRSTGVSKDFTETQSRSNAPTSRLGGVTTGANIRRDGFATPGPPATRPAFSASARPMTDLDARSRGFSPDPDLMTPRLPMVRPGAGLQSSAKRRRSFDLGEIDESLLVSKPKVIGPSSSGLKYTADFQSTPTIAKSSQAPSTRGGLFGHLATPTPINRRQPPHYESMVLSSPPPNPDLSFGDTQEDVQDDSSLEVPGEQEIQEEDLECLPQRKKRKSTGVFDDIEDIASSLPGNTCEEEMTSDEGGSSRDTRASGCDGIEKDASLPVETPHLRIRERNKENTTTTPPLSAIKTKSTKAPTTPPKVMQSFVSETTLGNGSTAKQWITVPSQPNFIFPRMSPSSKVNQAISAMAWSPSHRRRRKANDKYLTGGLASTVLGWAFDAQDSVLRANTLVEHSPHLQNGCYIVEIERLRKEANYVAIEGAAEIAFQDEEVTKAMGSKEVWSVRLVLACDASSKMAKHLQRGSRVEVRGPNWDMAVVGGEDWKIVINWGLKGVTDV